MAATLESASRRDRAAYRRASRASMIIPVKRFEANDSVHLADVERLDVLVDIAESFETMLIEIRSRRATIFLVSSGGVLYRYVVEAAVTSAPAEASADGLSWVGQNARGEPSLQQRAAAFEAAAAATFAMGDGTNPPTPTAEPVGAPRRKAAAASASAKAAANRTATSKAASKKAAPRKTATETATRGGGSRRSSRS